MTAQPEWHDATEEPPSRKPLWAYCNQGDYYNIEQVTWDPQMGWQSAFDRSILYDAGSVKAWAIVDYPASPIRMWRTP